MQENLVDLECVRPQKGDAVSPSQRTEWDAQIPAWQVVERNGLWCLERVFKFKNFALALAFTNQVGALAEAQDHHPAILTEWGKVTVWFWTHVTGGLHRNDYIMAAKTDRLFSG